ncbi:MULTISPECIES: hypothetical protein [Streptomyces]|uniref:DUF2993 domain-containing protein n=1 Tax=Streptomyces luteosporeus TaxID=173856 RepID=A0ABN3TL70_9ACTN
MRAGPAVLRTLLVCAGAVLACTAADARAPGPGAGAGFAAAAARDVAGAPVTLVARRAVTGPVGCVRPAGAGHPVLRCRLERATLTDAVVTVRTAGHPTTARFAYAGLSGGIDVDLTRIDARLLGVLPVHVAADLPLPAAAAPGLELTDVTLSADRVAVGGGRVRDAGLATGR